MNIICPLENVAMSDRLIVIVVFSMCICMQSAVNNNICRAYIYSTQYITSHVEPVLTVHHFNTITGDSCMLVLWNINTMHTYSIE